MTAQLKYGTSQGRDIVGNPDAGQAATVEGVASDAAEVGAQDEILECALTVERTVSDVDQPVSENDVGNIETNLKQNSFET